MSNQTGQLEIHRLSPSGEVRRRIRCLASRVTVFRANTVELIDAYRRALQGQEVPEERFSLLLDGVTFVPSEHLFIGFGEQFQITDTRTAKDLLAEHGVDPKNLEPLLLSHGLGGRGDVRLGLLSPSESRMLRILAATHSNHRVVVIDDPFLGIPERWINGYARDLADFAWTKSAIVIISSLSHRPDEWIENEIVARIQLEAPRKRTIGFGGEAGEAEAAVEAIRDKFKAQSISVEMPAPAQAEPSTPSRLSRALTLARSELQRISSRLSVTQWLVIGAIASGILLGYGIVKVMPKRSEAPQAVATLAPTVAAVATAPVLPTATPRTAISGYPPEAQEAILQAFNSDEADTTITRLKNPAPLAVPVLPTPRSMPTYDSPVYQPPEQSSDSSNDDEIQRRREEIRRRFLEAIQQQHSNR